MQEKDWQRERVDAISDEAYRVLDRIEKYNKTKNYNYWNNHELAAIKRATLDFNREAVRLRRGYSEDMKY